MKISQELILFLILGVEENIWVEELAEAPKIHRDFIVEPHEFGRSIEVVRVDTFIKNLDFSLDKLPINCHGVIIKAVVKVISDIIILCLFVTHFIKVEFIERVFEDVFRLHHIDWRRHHSLILKYYKLF